MQTNYKKRRLFFCFTIVFFFFLIEYYLINDIGSLKNGFYSFIGRVVTVGLSYYSALSFCTIALPLFLFALSYVGDLNPQYVVRRESKLRISLARLLFSASSLARMRSVMS